MGWTDWLERQSLEGTLRPSVRRIVRERLPVILWTWTTIALIWSALGIWKMLTAATLKGAVNYGVLLIFWLVFAFWQMDRLLLIKQIHALRGDEDE